MDNNKQQTISPGLYIVSTPIGNMEDMTFRALNILKKSDLILCEDTRRSGKLLFYFKIKNKTAPYHKFNETKTSGRIIELIKKNKIISIISDAGTPTISDPGLILINKCIDEKLKVYPIPGPSAVTSAVSVSGFSDRYIFCGFLPKKENELNSILKNIYNLDYSIVFFAPASKIDFYIDHFKKYFLDRKIVIAKEMTKIYEEFVREKVDSMDELPKKLKGEITIVISEKIKKKKVKTELAESVKIEILKMLKKYSHKDVVDFIAKKENLPKKIIYNHCLKIKK